MFDRRSASRAALAAAALAVLVGRVHGTIGLEWTAGDGGGIGWASRYGHAAVCFDDGVVVTTGGSEGNTSFSDVCSTTSGGTAPTTCVAPGLPWAARHGHAITRVPGSVTAFAVAGGTEAGGRTGRKHVLLTMNRGATFSEIGGNNALGKDAVYLGLVAPNATTFVAFGGMPEWKLFDQVFYNFVRRSTDSGATWATIRAEGGDGGECATSAAMWSARYGFGYAFMPGQNRIVVTGGRSAAGNEQDVWGSDDRGVCWTRLTFDLTAGGLSDGLVGAALVVFELSNGQEVLVLAGGARGLGRTLDNVYRSVDFGAAWKPAASLSASTGWSARQKFALVYNPLNANLVALGGLSDFWGGGRLNSVCSADVTRVRTATCAAALCASRPAPRSARSALRPHPSRVHDCTSPLVFVRHPRRTAFAVDVCADDGTHIISNAHVDVVPNSVSDVASNSISYGKSVVSNSVSYEKSDSVGRSDDRADEFRRTKRRADVSADASARLPRHHHRLGRRF